MFGEGQFLHIKHILVPFDKYAVIFALRCNLGKAALRLVRLSCSMLLQWKSLRSVTV